RNGSHPDSASQPPALSQYDVDGGFRQLLAECTLVELSDDGALEFIAFVKEGEAERKADIAEDLGVLSPHDDSTRAHHGGEIAIHERGARHVGDANHAVDDFGTLGVLVVLGL